MFKFFSKWIVKMLRPLTSRTQCRAVFSFLFTCRPWVHCTLVSSAVLWSGLLLVVTCHVT